MTPLEKLLAAKRSMLERSGVLANKEDLTEAEEEEFDKLLGDLDHNEERIQALEKYEKHNNDSRKSQREPVKPDVTPAEEERANDWDSFGDFLGAVMRAGMGRGQDSKLIEARGASGPTGASEAAPSAGGFLVGKDFVAELLTKTYETGVLAAKCRKIPIGATSNGLKINGIDESSRANGSRMGGVRAYWQNEAAATTASKPKFRQINLDLEKLMGLCYATDELLEDTVALGAVVTQAFPEEFGFKVDDAIINGTGAGQPLGILNADCTVSQAKETGQVAATIVFENISKMWSRVWPKSKQNGVWLMNSEIEPQLDSLVLAVGTAGVPAYMPPGGLSGQPYGTLKGRPVIPIEQCAALGTVGDLIFADLGQYLLIDKGGIQAAESIHVLFLYGENTFRFTYRVNGQPIWNSALTPYKGSATQSPFVTLATRS